MKKLLLLGMALATACAAYAIPTISGPTGGFELPTADVATGVQAAIDQPTTSTGIAFPDTRLLVGAAQNFEIGAAYEKDQPIIEFWDINAKASLPLNVGSTKVAVGALYGGISPLTNNWSAYIAASTEVLDDVKATANLGYAKVSRGGLEQNSITFGLAAEKPISENAALGAELLFGDEVGGTTHGNVYATFGLTDNLTARAALAGIGQDTQIWLGATYTFGK